jgi:hypothetical protein
MVNVSADYAVQSSSPGLQGDRFLEGADEGHRPLDPTFEIGGQGPIAETEMAPQPVQRVIEPQRKLVAMVAQVGEPARRAHDHVELVAVQHAVAPPLLGGVYDVPVDFDAAKTKADVVAQGLIVIAGNEHETHTLAHAAEQLLHHIVVRLRPVRTPLDAPEVDDIADQIDEVRLAVAEKIDQPLGLR